MGMRSRTTVHSKSKHDGARRATLCAVRLCGVVCVILFALALPLITAPAAVASGRPPGGRLNDPAVRKVDIAEPSIVRIVLLFHVRITLTLCGQDITLPRSYLVGSLGSGAFISSNGDILTADHVVAANGAEVVFNPQAAQDIANLLDNNPSCHLQTPISPSDVANGFLDAAGINYTTQVSNVEHMVWQGTPFSGQLNTTSTRDILAALSHVPHQNGTVVSQSAVSDNDVAILHVNLTDTPSIQLDDSSQVAADDQLTIIGYPGNGDEFRALSDQTVDANDLLTPSVNTVTVSSIKTDANGAKLIQVGGNVEHGDSGGPALDASGNIVGVVSFGTSDGSAETVGSTSFLRSSNDVLSLVSAANINTQPGSFEKQWEQAFADYAATYPGHWHKAARELDALASGYPNFLGVQPYKDYADNAAVTEQVPVDTSSITLVIIASLVVALLLVALIVLTFVLLRRGRKSRLAVATSAAPQGAPFGGYGPPSQFGGYGPPSQYGTYAPPPQYGGYPTATPYTPRTTPFTPGPPAPYTSSSAQSEASPPSAAPAAVSTQTREPEPAMGRMTLPPSFGSGSSASNAGSTGNGVPGATPDQPAYSTPAGYSWLPQVRPLQPAQPAPSGAWGENKCVNGHVMPPSELYCALCGAPRTPTPSPS